ILGHNEVTKENIDLILAEIDHRLTLQMDEILHQEEFQKLESAWRSLFFLVKQIKGGENCEILVMDLDQNSLLQDFESSSDILDSFLYKITYTDELGSFGGHPYGVIVANYQFGLDAEDLYLLRCCGEVASACYAPFIAGAQPTLLGLEDFSELITAKNLAENIEKNLRFAKWRSVRSHQSSRFIGLTLPEFLLRKPYDFKSEHIRSFPYVESSEYLWGNAAFALASCMLRSFIKYRWPLDIIGSDGGSVDGLMWPRENAISKDQVIIPLKILMTDRVEGELTKLGFIPLTYQKGTQIVSFESANSIQAALVDSGSENSHSLDQRLAVQIPYLLIVCRLSHYIKVIQRDNIGSSKNRQQLEDELNSWLIQYVSDMENPSAEVRARRPLRRARLSVAADEENPSQYKMELTVIPHFRYMGAAFSLSLLGKL
ncbi:MAG: type VI secretion system contractile sheath large subunit, partial [SAR324 cluster bacterium]|nr:type VI secretion system contractile sheath large subunit [SAR324 cluster bacterium]